MQTISTGEAVCSPTCSVQISDLSDITTADIFTCYRVCDGSMRGGTPGEASAEGQLARECPIPPETDKLYTVFQVLVNNVPINNVNKDIYTGLCYREIYELTKTQYARTAVPRINDEESIRSIVLKASKRKEATDGDEEEEELGHAAVAAEEINSIKLYFDTNGGIAVGLKKAGELNATMAERPLTADDIVGFNKLIKDKGFELESIQFYTNLDGAETIDQTINFEELWRSTLPEDEDEDDEIEAKRQLRNVISIFKSIQRLLNTTPQGGAPRIAPKARKLFKIPKRISFNQAVAALTKHMTKQQLVETAQAPPKLLKLNKRELIIRLLCA